jgi:hypothetical protein
MRDERLMPAHIKTSLPVGVNEHLGKPLHKTILWNQGSNFSIGSQIILLCFKTDM